MEQRAGWWWWGGLALLAGLTGCSARPDTAGSAGAPLVAEWPAQKLVYVADGAHLRVFRIGLGLAPLAERVLQPGLLERLDMDADSGRLTLVTAGGRMEVDGQTLR